VDDPAESNNLPEAGPPQQVHAPAPTPTPNLQYQFPFVIQQTTAHSGPLPVPEQLGAYEAIHPGAAAWIFRQAELNAEHFRTMEEKALQARRQDNLLHRLLPFALVLTCIVSCTLIATLASAVWGIAGFGATIAAVMVAYLTGRAPPAAHRALEFTQRPTDRGGTERAASARVLATPSDLKPSWFRQISLALAWPTRRSAASTAV
jgi:uncharacterized membrane protein